jgi:F0F1-type ATP synthase assembly protein I
MTVAARQFIIKILIFTIIIFAIALALFSTALKPWYFGAYPYQILLIATITAIGHLWIMRASDKNMRRFTTAFMASVTLKLMVYLTFMLVCLLIDRSHVAPFVVTFIILYILFTIFEVFEVLSFIKKHSKIGLGSR